MTDEQIESKRRFAGEKQASMKRRSNSIANGYNSIQIIQQNAERPVHPICPRELEFFE